MVLAALAAAQAAAKVLDSAVVAELSMDQGW